MPGGKHFQMYPFTLKIKKKKTFAHIKHFITQKAQFLLFGIEGCDLNHLPLDLLRLLLLITCQLRNQCYVLNSLTVPCPYRLIIAISAAFNILPGISYIVKPCWETHS